MKALLLISFFSTELWANKAMQEAMQGIVNSNIFSNNIYNCKVVTPSKTSMMKLSFTKKSFVVSFIGKKENFDIVWTGNYQLEQKGLVRFITEKFKLRDKYGVRSKDDKDVLFNVKGNSSLFNLTAQNINYSCKRIRH